MKKLMKRVWEKQWFGQKTLFLRILEFYFFRVFGAELGGFPKNFAKNIKKKLIFDRPWSLIW